MLDLFAPVFTGMSTTHVKGSVGLRVSDVTEHLLKIPQLDELHL